MKTNLFTTTTITIEDVGDFEVRELTTGEVLNSSQVAAESADLEPAERAAALHRWDNDVLTSAVLNWPGKTGRESYFPVLEVGQSIRTTLLKSIMALSGLVDPQEQARNLPAAPSA